MNICKKILLPCIIALASVLNAQQSIEFRVTYLPMMTYTQSSYQTSEVTIHYKGSKDMMEKLKQKGLKNPTQQTSSTQMLMIIQTGQLGEEQEFPLSIKIHQMTGYSKIDLPQNTTVYGSAKENESPKLDSISAPGMEEKVKETMLRTMQTVVAQVKLPKNDVKVGDKFVVETPITIPVAGIEMQMDVTTTYKLESVKDGLANFSVKQVYTFKGSSSQFKFTGSGKGGGKMIYDIALHHHRENQVDSELKMDMEINGLTLKMTTKNKSFQNTAIAKAL